MRFLARLPDAKRAMCWGSPANVGDDMSQSTMRSLRPIGIPDFIVLGELSVASPLIACAWLLGDRIDTRDAAGDPVIGPLAQASGLVFVFRYGVVVTVGASSEAIARLSAVLSPHVVGPTAMNERESVIIDHGLDQGDRIGADGQVRLTDLGRDRLTLTAIVLARSVALARDEFLLGEAFDRIAPLASDLQENGRARLSIPSAMRLVGNVLVARHRVVGAAQVDERPDLLWDHPELDRLYTRLETEYELKERAEVLQRKLSALGDFTETLLDIVQDKRAFHVEIAIIALITFEVVLSLFGLLAR